MTGPTVVTVSVVEPTILPEAAEIVVFGPADTAVARPVVVIVAVAVFEEVHVTVAVRSFELLSLYVPVAWNCVVVPTAADEFAGVTVIDWSVGWGVGVVPLAR